MISRKEADKRFKSNNNSQNKKKKGGFGKKLVSVLVSIALAGSIGLAFNNEIEYLFDVADSYSVSENLEDYLMQSKTGAYLKLPVDENPINIVLQNISDEDKIKVISAINDLDNISTNLDYTILDTDDLKIQNKIYITDGETPNDALGLTNINYNNLSGEISYPIYISIDMDACKGFTSDITGEDAVTAVTKHELGHSLGFKDLYDRSMINESIMWYSIYTETYTKSDEERIREYYGGVSEDASERYDYYYDENNNLCSVKPKNDALKNENSFLNGQQSNFRLIHKDAFAEIYEPKHLIITNEKDLDIGKKSQKEDIIIEREF
ncbi:MAG: hypothetical protein IJX17_02910 [Clostridia bacterium]|nr:hypothetical protein [Clostridia bacterium]